MKHYTILKGFCLLLLLLLNHNAMTQKTSYQDIDLNLRYGNMSTIKQIDISPDGKTLASLDYEGYVVLWDINSRMQYAAINGLKNNVSSILFSPDGKTLIGAGRNYSWGGEGDKLYYWDYKSGKLLKEYPLEFTIDEMSLTPDKKQLFTYGGKFGIQIRDIESGEVIRKIKLGLLGISTPSDLVLAPNKDYIACVTQMSTKAGKQAFNAVKVMANKNIKYGHIQIIDFETGDTRKEIYVGSRDGEYLKFYDIVISPDSRYIIAAGEFKNGRMALVIDSETEKVIKKFKVKTTLLSVSPDNKYIYAGTTKSIRKIDITDYNTVSEFDATKHFEVDTTEANIILAEETEGKSRQLVEMNNKVLTNIKFSPDSKYFITAGSSGAGEFSIDLWDYETEKRLSDFKSPISKVTSASYIPNKNVVIIGTNDGDIQVLDIKTGRTENTLKLIEGTVLAEYSPDYKYIIGSSTNLNKYISLGFIKFRYPQITKIWDSNTYELVDSIPGYGNAILSDDGKYLLVVQQLTIQKLWRLYDFKTMELIRENKSIFLPVDFTKDNKQVLAKKGGNFNIFDLEKFRKTIKTKEVKGGRLKQIKFNADKTKIMGTLARNFSFKGELREWTSQGELIRNYVDDEHSKVLTADYSPDGNTIVCGLQNSDYTSSIKFFDTSTGNLLDSVSNLGLPIKYTTDGNYLLAYTDEHFKGLNLIDINNKQLLGTHLKINGKPDGLFFTPDRYYSSTKDGYDAISYFYNGITYPFEQFDLKFNRPDIVADRMPYTSDGVVDLYKMAYLKRVDKMGVNIENLSNDFNVPVIEVSNIDELPISTSDKFISLKVKMADKLPLLSYNVWVNDVPIYGVAGSKITQASRNALEMTLKVELVKGMNKIQISCLNIGGVESTKVTKFIEYVGEAPKSNLYIVTIGVSKFSESTYNLNYAAKDANDLMNMFLSDTISYENIYSKKILNEDVTVERILELKDFLAKSTVDDRVIIFYAGHGLLDKELNYYLSTTDVNFNDPSERGLLFQDFEKIFDDVPAREKLVFIDACHSGEIDKEENISFTSVDGNNENISFRGFKRVGSTPSKSESANAFEIMKEIFVDLRRGSGAFIISSAGGGEFAFEGESWKNGVFTYSILKGISDHDSDLNNDGIVMLSELADAVQLEVRQLTNGLQNPTYRQENIEFDIPIWFYQD